LLYLAVNPNGGNMKMTFPIFFGVLVVLAGLSILLDALFKVHIPFVRSAFALFFIFLGVRMLFGAWAPRTTDVSTSGAAVMSELHFAPTEANGPMKYDVIFGRGAIDLTQLKRPARPTTLELNVVFSSSTLTIDPAWPIVIEGSAAFGEVRMPDQATAAFGTARFRTHDSDEPILRIRVNTVFGSCHVFTAPATAEPPRPISAVTP
jgi:hypothetical protein